MWFPASQPPEGLTSWRLPVMKRKKRNKPSGCFMSPHLKSSQVDFPSQIKWEIFWVKKHQLCTLERLFVYKTWWKDTFDWVIKEIWFIPELYFCLSCALWHLMRWSTFMCPGRFRTSKQARSRGPGRDFYCSDLHSNSATVSNVGKAFLSSVV